MNTKPSTRNGGSLGELSSGTFNSKLHQKKDYNSIHLLPGKVGKMSMLRIRKFGRRSTVPGLRLNRTQFFHAFGAEKGGY